MLRVFVARAQVQNRFQAVANKVARSKAAATKAQHNLSEATKRFYALCDSTFGQDTYVIYESRAPYPDHRLARQMSQPRQVNLKRLEATLPSEQYKAVTRTVTVLDMTALDNALARGEVDAALVADATTYGCVASLVWQKTSPNTKYPLQTGQIGIVGDAVEQEQ